MSHLKRFPIGILKIDQSFVRDLTTDADDASIVSSVISMGKGLHMRVVAEGIETREQLAFLQEHSCPEGQGHYFGEAMDAEQFTRLLGCTVVEPRLLDGRTARKSPPEQVGNSSHWCRKPSARRIARS